jgi:D-glycero-alpha-D-manno-heptose-7-phosphate kinase
MQDMVPESLSILGGGQDINAFGTLLHETWRTKRGLSSMVSSADVNAIYEQALSAGAIGGKLMGAGGGGFFLLFVPPLLQERVRERLRPLLCVPFQFETAGSQVSFFKP